MKKLFTPLFVPFIAFVVLCDVSVARDHNWHQRHGRYNQSVYFIEGKLIAPEIGVRTGITGKTVIKVGRLAFKDSNGNGRLEPYEDWRRSPLERAGDLVARMTVEEKIGLLIEFWDYGTPAVVTEFPDDIDALLCEFGADDVTVFDMVFQARSEHYKPILKHGQDRGTCGAAF
jgi:hypothetical protein